jgi:hypothetical protein
VNAVSLESMHKKKNHRHHGHSKDYLMTEYESPFGMDATHGYGGKDQKRVEDLIDQGLKDDVDVTDDEEKTENKHTKGKIGLVQQERKHKHHHENEEESDANEVLSKRKEARKAEQDA